MARKFNVSILGNGRIGEAILYYFKKNNIIGRVDFLTDEQQLKNYDLLIGALPGGIGLRCLELALKYRRHLIDISDVEPEYYLRKKKEAKRKGIVIIAGCGFCPGLVNFILGRELFSHGDINEVEIKAGSLSPKRFFFPFLWCFEDLILEHQIPSWQIISGRKTKLPPFCGYRKEKILGIEAESYFSASGFENLLNKINVKNLKCRVIRPYGFMAFFHFLQNQGFLKKENIRIVKGILENKKEDNFTLAEIMILAKNKKIVWQLRSFAKGREKFNSMQKITASVPAVIGKFLLEGRIRKKGILFMQDLAREKSIFTGLLKEVKKEGILIRRSSTYCN